MTKDIKPERSMTVKSLDELVNKNNINQLAEYLAIDISKLREYLCSDVIIPARLHKKIKDFFNFDGCLLSYTPYNSIIPGMVERVSTQKAKEAILLADKIADYILFYRNAVINGRKLEETWNL